MRITIDSNPRFKRPEILCHPPIPTILYGVNPRNIKGAEWWDKTRKVAYERNNNCCWSCGESTLLHAHETYEYDYDSLVATPSTVTALCVPCHTFAHIGIAWSKQYGEYSKIREPLFRGLEILRKAGLEPNWMALSVEYFVKHNPTGNLYLISSKFVDQETYEQWASPMWVLKIGDEEYSRLGGR